MRRFLYLFVALLAYLLLSSRSCGPDKMDEAATREAEQIQERKDIRTEFESDDLSQKSLRAFEVIAVQKLADLADFLRIYTNKQMDTTFKGQSGKMIRELFISDSIQINDCLLTHSAKRKLSLNELFNKLSTDNSCDLSFDSIQVTRSFHQMNEFKYAGNLSFSRRMKVCTPTDTVFIPPARLETEIFVTKVKKSFGNDTLQVWSVFLGNIR